MNRTRQHNEPFMWQAGGLSLLVHGMFLVLLVMGFNWKTVPVAQVMSVELWDSVPVPKVEPPPEPPKPEPVIEPEPAPKPPPPPEPKAEIQVKPKPVAKAKPEPKPKPKPKEAPKPDPKLKAQEAAKQLEDLKRAMLADSDPAPTQNKEAQQIAAARNAQAQAQAQAIASSGVLDAAKAKIVAKIKRNVNSQVCGNGKPVLEFEISLMPTGEVIGAPRLKSGSGIAACDSAVERAILQAQPLPVPREPELFAHFRELSLKFRPNDNN